MGTDCLVLGIRLEQAPGTRRLQLGGPSAQAANRAAGGVTPVRITNNDATGS